MTTLHAARAAVIRQAGILLARYGDAVAPLLIDVSMSAYERQCARVEAALRRIEAGADAMAEMTKQLREMEGIDAD